MIELTNTCPEIWKKCTSQLVNVISQIIMQKTFEDGTRSAATEVVLALSSQMPASLRKIEETKSMLLPAFVQMLTEVDDDLNVWGETPEEKEGASGNTEPYHVAINAINCISNDLGEKNIMLPCSALIQQCRQSANWKERQAGYMLLGLIAESCKEALSKGMSEAIQLACAGVVDANPRVRYAGLSCLALLLTELAPKAQKKYHAELMPKLLSMMQSEELIKMQTRAVSTVINFVNGLHSQDDEDEEEVSDTIIKQYSPSLFEIIVQLLKKAIDTNYEPLQEECMNLLSAVAQLIDKEFAKYYNSLMPLMMQILSNVGMANAQQQQLRARTIESVGYMIEAVAEERSTFFENVQSITQQLVSLLCSGQLSYEDPQNTAIKEALCKIAFFMKEEFHPYFQLIAPTLLTDAKQQIDIKLTSADDPSAGDDNQGVKLKLKGMEGEQRLSMNTTALESKILAYKLFHQISDNMGTAFAPFCEAALPQMLQDINYPYSKAIKKYAMKTCVNILHAVGETHNVPVFQTALYPVFIQMIEKGVKDEDLKTLRTVLKHFWLMLKVLNEDKAKPYLSDEQFTVIGALLQKVLNVVREVKTQS